MKGMLWQRILTLLAVFLFGLTSFASAEVDIETSIQPSRVSVGEPLELTIVISGAGTGIRPPKIPEYEHFRSYSQGHSEEISFVNGRMSSKSVFSFVLIPNTPGRYVLDRIEVVIGNKRYKTGALEVDVLQSTAQTPRPSGKPQARIVPPTSRSLPPEYMTGQEIFVRAWTNKEEVYINEPVYLTYTLYTRASATFKGFDEEPVTHGFWVEEFPPQGLQTRHEKKIGGYRYVIADVRTLALFPTKAGIYSVEPGKLKVDVEIRQRDPFSQFYSRDIFGRPRRRAPTFFTELQPRILETEAIRISVKPFPRRSRPKNFEGAVGRYRLEASLDAREVEEGEAVTYSLHLKGEGNLNTVELPELPAMDHFKYYEGKSSLDLRKDRFIVEGEKTIETVLLPRKAGDYTIPKLKFTYFDPFKDKYVTLETPQLRLKVKKSTKEERPLPPRVKPPGVSKDLERLEEDIHFIKTKPGPQKQVSRPLFLKPECWIWIGAVLLAAILVLFGRGIWGRMGQDRQGLRMKRSHQIARQRLKSAKSSLKVKHEREFYDKLSHSVYGYFADKLNIEPGAVGIGALEMKLQDRASSEEIGRVKKLFSEIDFGRFSTAQVSLGEMKRIYEEADHVISHFEGKHL